MCHHRRLCVFSYDDWSKVEVLMGVLLSLLLFCAQAIESIQNIPIIRVFVCAFKTNNHSLGSAATVSRSKPLVDKVGS